MRSRDGFGLHIDFAQGMLARNVSFAPSGLNFLQTNLPVPEEMGSGSIVHTQLGRGVSFVSGDGEASGGDITMRTRELPGNHVAFPFQLPAEPARVGIDGIAQPMELERSDSYILGPTVIGTEIVPAGTRFHRLLLFVDDQTIDSCFSDLQQALPAALKRAFTRADSEPFCLRGRATTAMGLAMRQMLTCNLRGPVARLYLEAKVLEIAALRLAQVGDEEYDSRPPKLMRSDIDRLEEARHILEISFDEPPTISELAYAVGLNRTKLKAGFKHRFGTTVLGFVRSQRMRQALVLLSDGECNVGEAAAKVGYNSVSAFAAAFKAEFGFSPRLARGCTDVTEIVGSNAPDGSAPTSE